MSTKFLVDLVLPGNLPPVSVSRSFFGTKFAELGARCSAGQTAGTGSNPSLFDSEAMRDTINQPGLRSAQLYHELSNGDDG